MKQLDFRSTDFSRCFDLKKLAISLISDSVEYTHYAIFNIYKKVSLIYPKCAAIGFFFQGTQRRVRNSRGKQAIRVRATEVLLYFLIYSVLLSGFILHVWD